MPLNPYFGFRNVFGGGGGGYDPSDPAGFNTDPMKRAFTDMDQTPDDSGINPYRIRRAMTPAFSDYTVDTPDDINRRQSGLRQYQEGPATKAYLDYAGQTPNREDYEPSKWGKVLATLSGAAAGYKNPAAGIKVASDIRDDPYNEAYGDYSNKLKALHDAAQIESQNENYAALSGYRNYGAETGRGTLDERIRSNQVKEGQAGSWNMARIDQFGKTNAQKAADLAEKQREFGVTSIETGKHHRATEKIGETNAASGQVRAGASVTAANAAATNATTNQAREKTYESDVTGKNEARRNKPATQAKGPSPAEISNATKTAAAQIRAENADRYGDFTDKYGNVTPPTGFFGGTKSTADYNKFIEAVKQRHAEILRKKYPNYSTSNASPTPTPTAPNVDAEVDY